MRIIIYGPQGSGKTTQAELLAKRLDVPMFSAGKISREIAEQNTPEGKYVKEVIDKGEPTPHEIIVREMDRRFEQPDSQRGFVLDGYPRYAQQIEALAQAAVRGGWEIDKVLVLVLSEEAGVDRVLSRAKKEGRADDNPASIKKRLALYHAQTEPIISYFRHLGKVVEINGEPSITEVQSEILAKLGLQ